MVEEKLDKILAKYVNRIHQLTEQPHNAEDIKLEMLAFLEEIFPYCRNATLDEAITALDERSSKEWKPPQLVVHELKEEVK